jgi:TolA-binding protein
MEYTKVIFEANDQQEIADYVYRYSIQLAPGGMLRIPGGSALKQNEKDWIRDNKSKIVAYLEKQIQDKKDRQKKIESIPGLKEVEKALDEMEEYRIKLNRAIHSGSSKAPMKPKHDIDEMRKKYPVAFLWIKAESFLNASNDRKYSAGKQAQDFILDGDLKKAEKAMDNWTSDGPFWD